MVVSFILIFVLIGIPLIFALGVLNVVFSIIGAINASKNILWKYPMSIPFLKN